jgi:hypothetical protein
VVGLIGKILVSSIFLGFSGYEIYMRLIQRIPWDGFSKFSTNVIYFLAPIWIIGAAAIWRRNYFARVFVGIAAAFALVHGILLRAGQDPLGRIFMLGSLILGLLLTIVVHSERFAVSKPTSENLKTAA